MIYSKCLIQAWWPYQEAPTQPEEGRWRLAHVIETEIPKDDRDDDGKLSFSLKILKIGTEDIYETCS